MVQLSRTAKYFLLFYSSLYLQQSALPSRFLNYRHYTYNIYTIAIMSLSPQKFALSKHCYCRIKTEDFEVFFLLPTAIYVSLQYNPSVVSWVKFMGGYRCIIYSHLTNNTKIRLCRVKLVH